MRRKMQESDFFSFISRHSDSIREIFLDRIAQSYFTAVDHVLQQQCSEYFCDGANFENAVAIDIAASSVIELPTGKNSRAFVVRHSDHNRDPKLIRINVVTQDCLNFFVR